MPTAECAKHAKGKRCKKGTVSEDDVQKVQSAAPVLTATERPADYGKHRGQFIYAASQEHSLCSEDANECYTDVQRGRPGLLASDSSGDERRRKMCHMLVTRKEHNATTPPLPLAR